MRVKLAPLLTTFVLILFPVNLALAYDEANQHNYPYYLPEDVYDKEAADKYINFIKPLSGDDSTEKIYNFSREYLRLDAQQAAFLTAVLDELSGLSPGYSDGEYCGLAVWDCQGPRMRQLQTFAETHNLGQGDLRAQVLFLSYELSSELEVLNVGERLEASGSQASAFQKLREISDLSDLEKQTGFLNSGLFEKTVDQETRQIISARALTIYDKYHSNAIEPVDIPEETVVVNPIPIPPYQPDSESNTDCSAGLTETGYIEKISDKDSLGPFIVGYRYLRSSNQSGYIETHRCLKEPVISLFANYNAGQDKDPLGGGGWRSNANQIELRKTNCGTTQHDIYQKKPSLCDPPTARPGTSNHQRGLAVDFFCINNGRVSYLTKNNCQRAFSWLKSNAYLYGLKNLPSEPWHWSVDGR